MNSLDIFDNLIVHYEDKIRRYTILRGYGDIDSKFRFVILASKRAKLLLKGSKPKIKSTSKNLIRVAQEEVRKGLVKYEIIHPKEDVLETDEEDFSEEEKTEDELAQIDMKSSKKKERSEEKN